MVSELQKKTAQAIVNIFETGRARGDYGSVTFHPDDPGHLTYGRSQTTLASGNLYLLIKAYCDTDGARLAAEFLNYLYPLAHSDTLLDHDMEFRACLIRAGSDPVMQDVQDQFFDRVYWEPSLNSAVSLEIISALGTGVVYDSNIHGSWRLIRDQTNAAGLPKHVTEQVWITRYVQNRRNWLANHPNALLQKTVYRMDSFKQLINDNKWNLPLPLRVREVKITEAALLEAPPIRVSAENATERALRLETPLMRGDDVGKVQAALHCAGMNIDVDKVFGKQTQDAVIEFQRQKGLTADGIVGPATRAALGL